MMEDEMEDERALVPLAATPGDAIGVALQAVYETLPGHVVGFVEYHRIEATADYLAHLRAIRDALAPYGAFHDWCDAAGVNYAALSKALSRQFGAVAPDTRLSHSKLGIDAASTDSLLDTATDAHGGEDRDGGDDESAPNRPSARDELPYPIVEDAGDYSTRWSFTASALAKKLLILADKKHLAGKIAFEPPELLRVSLRDVGDFKRHLTEVEDTLKYGIELRSSQNGDQSGSRNGQLLLDEGEDAE